MPLECEHIRNEFSALLDNELNPEDRELVEEHLSECSDCLRELHGYKQVSDAYRYHHPVKAPADFEARFHERLSPGLRRVYGVPWLQYALGTAAAIALVAGVAVWRGRLMDSVPMQLSRLAEEQKAEAPAAEAAAPDYFKNEAPVSTAASDSATEEPASIGEAESLDASRNSNGTYNGAPIATGPAVQSPAPETYDSGIVLQAQAAPPASMPAPSPVADTAPPLEESVPMALNPAPGIPAGQEASSSKPEAPAEIAPEPEVGRLARADVPAAAPARRSAGGAVPDPVNAPAPAEMPATEAVVAAATAEPAHPAPEAPGALGKEEGGSGSGGELLGLGGSGGGGGGFGGGGFGGSAVLGQRWSTSDAESTPPVDGADATGGVAMEMKDDEGVAAEPVPGDLTFGADTLDSREAGAAPRPGTAKEEDAEAADKTEVATRSAKTWREREFNLREGVWREAGYTGEPIKKVAIPSPAWNKLLDSYTDLNVLCAAPEPVIVRLGNTWYEIRRTKPPVPSKPPRKAPG